jgi:hypothetical protein
VPLAIAFARAFAAVFETPFLRKRDVSVTIRRQDRLPGQVPV